MEHLNTGFATEIKNNFFQQITGSYYLIPNIIKCLKRILEITNCELSLFASFIYYTPSSEKKTIIKNCPQEEDQNHFNLNFSELSEIIFKENYPNINCTKRQRLDINVEACTIPIRYELNFFGIIVLFGDNDSFSQDNIIEDSIGAYVTAACIGNHLITKRGNILNNFFGLCVNQEVSIKKLLEWRIQELIKNISYQLPSEKNLFHEISLETEKTLITTVMKKSNNNQSKAAKYLGINRNTLRKKIKELNIS